MAATLIGFTAVAARAQASDDLFVLPVWDHVFSIRSGAGYKDNVFLSHSDPQSGAFVSAGGDVLLLRVAETGPQFSFFASADVNYYLCTEPVYEEYLAFAQAKIEQDFGGRFNAFFETEYFFQDQVVDISFVDPSVTATNPALRTAALRGHTLTWRPGLRTDLPRQFRLTVEAPLSRQFYDRPLDDYWKTGGELTLGRDYGRKSYVSLSYEPSWRMYDSDEALTATGAAIAGTERERFQQDALLTWRHYWDEHRRWRTTSKLGGRLVEENGGGFADYAQYSASFQILYRAGSWEFSADARARRYEFANQTISATDLTKRRRTDWSAGARVERQFGKHLKVSVAYEYEQALSNDELETYDVNTVTGSVLWEF